MENKKRRFLPAVALIAVLAHSVPGVAAEIIRISGSSCAIGTMKLLGDAFRKNHPDVKFRIIPRMGTGGAAKAVIAGRLDIALGDRPLKEEERSPGVSETRYARTPLVFCVNPFVETGDLKLDEVARIYGGKRDRWDNRTRVRLVLRPPGDITTEILRSMSPAMRASLDNALSREGMLVVHTDEDMADAIENTPGAFGAVALSLILSEKKAIRVLSVDGIVPSVRTLADGTYPYSKTFSMITTKNRRTAVRRFMEFVRSEAGAAILSRNGQVAER